MRSYRLARYLQVATHLPLAELTVLSTLRQIVQGVFAQEADFAASVRMLVQRVRDALGNRGIYLLNESRDGYRLVATKGLNESQVGEVTLAQDQGWFAGRRVPPLPHRMRPRSIQIFTSYREIGEGNRSTPP